MTKLIKWLFFSSVLILPFNAHGQTINAASCNASDVQNAINRATEGQTVTIPSSTCTWTSGVTISGKGITVQGAGAGRVIAVDMETTAIAIGTGSKTFTGVRNDMGATAYLNSTAPPITVGQTLRIIELGFNANFMQGTVTGFSGGTLVMNITSSGGACGTLGPPNTLNSNCKRWLITTIPSTVLVNNLTSGQGMINVTEDSSFHTVVTGIHFGQGASGGGTVPNIYLARNNPSGMAILVHDNYLESQRADLLDGNTSRGVVWNNSFVFSPFSEGQYAAIRTKDPANQSMPTSWSTPSTMGTADTTGQGNLYFETNDIHAVGAGTDIDDNSRTVFRYNVWDNAAGSSHGADTSYIGLRHFEFYNNVGIFEAYTDGSTANMGNGWFYIRGGTFTFHDNTLPSLTSQDWGAKSDILLEMQTLQREDNYACWGAGFTTPGQYYPAPRQIGLGYVTGNGKVTYPPLGYNNATVTTNANYVGSVYVGDSEPAYIWNNSRTLSIGLGNYGLNNGSTSCLSTPTPDTAANYVVSGRDYFNGTPKPGYTPYQYPHPLTLGQSSGNPPAPPTNLTVVVQ